MRSRDGKRRGWELSDERAPNKVDKWVGARVRARRLEIAMSQERLSDILGVTFQQVQKYEKGVNRITSGRLHDISEALEVPIAFFFDGMVKSPAKSNGAEDFVSSMTDPDTVELVRLFTAVKSKKLKRRVLDLVRAMVAEG